MKRTKLSFVSIIFYLFFSFLLACTPKTSQDLFDDYESYFEEGKYKLAQKAVDQIIELDSATVFLYNIRGEAYLNDHNYKAAVADFSNTLNLDPENINALANRGYANFLLKNYNEALEDLKKAVVLKGFKPLSDTIFNYKVQTPDRYKDPLLSDIVYIRGRVYYEKFDLFLACEDFSFCIDTSLKVSADAKFDKLPECYYWRGLTWERMNEDNRACLDMKIAAESGLTQALEYLNRNCKE